ncbi:uncharacterized protein BDR25DRAFT_261103 [Lindgomyces ingoldianus]|uniref:Uncharacterized protein n=1 Tax=Lindgomyces ingoldianus TaxID=673940 RepID=A0ACB6QV07_9PLEO|nr:uncharacterized protein BDR25DRAFT_261103 [Lindgomyces ingoldianus]KAF2470849.1 hypothetical protein BDR25DRAFT_261103 [Lindgomyces ingoldianus]
MFSRTYRPVIFSLNSRLSHTIRCTHQRGYSVISTHSSFPATLLRLNAGSAFNPFWFERQANEPSINDPLEQSTENHENADAWTNCLALDRATLMPNTFMMQEIIRMAADNYFENKENGMSIERPFIFTVPKGTVLPNTLILLRETPSQFSLRPSLHASPNDLDNILHEFYSKHADKQDVYEWLTDHKYEDAIAAENEKEWMAR